MLPELSLIYIKFNNKGAIWFFQIMRKHLNLICGFSDKHGSCKQHEWAYIYVQNWWFSQAMVVILMTWESGTWQWLLWRRIKWTSFQQFMTSTGFDRMLFLDGRSLLFVQNSTHRDHTLLSTHKIPILRWAVELVNWFVNPYWISGYINWSYRRCQTRCQIELIPPICLCFMKITLW